MNANNIKGFTMETERYGKLSNAIGALYNLRRNTTGQDQVAVQKALSLAFDISYERPVQDQALKDLAAAAFKIDPNTMVVLRALKDDAKKYYPNLITRLDTYLVWS